MLFDTLCVIGIAGLLLAGEDLETITIALLAASCLRLLVERRKKP